jgi:hypothetical protein
LHYRLHESDRSNFFNLGRCDRFLRQELANDALRAVEWCLAGRLLRRTMLAVQAPMRIGVAKTRSNVMTTVVTDRMVVE